MPVDVKSVSATAVEPPPLVKGKRGSQIPPELLKEMAKTIKDGQYATITDGDGKPVNFDTRDKAQSALTRFRKALKDVLPKGTELTGRIWGDTKGSDESGNEVYKAPFHFALADKAKIQ